jgi:hypothetical protein
MNKAEQKNIFDPVGEERSRRENIKAALESCEELIVTTMGEAKLRPGSKVFIVMSRAEAFRLGLIKRKQGETFEDPAEIRVENESVVSPVVEPVEEEEFDGEAREREQAKALARVAEKDADRAKKKVWSLQL